ncbi:MAG: hypothetical protein EXS51_03835 [Candidatus Taylorbacteria bacterium]|nr:hypothetical protein [Candidatus Taylorbacteria bacterium]
MDLRQFLAEKALAIEKDLARGVERYKLLQPGQTLRFEIRVVTSKTVEGDVNCEAAVPTTFTASTDTDASNFEKIPPEKLALKLLNLRLPTRALSWANNNDCFTVGSLLIHYEKVPNWRNMGPKTYAEVQQAFKRIGISLPWPTKWSNWGQNSIGQLEQAQLQRLTHLTVDDWKNIFKIEWRAYQEQTLLWFQTNQNSPARANEVLRPNYKTSNLYSFTTINNRFRNVGLRYRLHITTRAKSSFGETGLVHNDDLICIGELKTD